MRQPWSFLLLAGLAGLAACRQPEPGGPDRRIVLWEMEDAAVAPYIDSVLEAFRKLPGNADIKIVRTHYHPEDLRQQFQTASIAGNPPDLLITQSDPAGIYSVSGFILPVDGLFDMRRYNKTAVEAISQDGKAWGVPISNGNHLMLMYNKSLAPQPPRTTAELFDFCDRRAPGLKLDRCMAFFLGEPYWLVPWMGAFGGWPMDGRRPTLDTPATRRALEFVLELKGRGYVPQECDYNCADALFTEKKVAFVIGGDWAISRYEAQLKSDLGIARIPKLSQTGRWPTPMVSGAYFMLSSKLQGAKLELAKRLVDFYTDEENQIGQAKTLMRLPALSQANRAKVIMDDPNMRASMEQLLVGRPMPMATEMRAVWDAMRPLYGRVLSGKMTVDEAVPMMQRDAESKIREMNE
ncbi:MAG: extracellular solute-binding protein [Elusimicrobia bacterium]|nr:extracellular solute-binding protein [Elusimicrobiota bacterium]